MAVPAARLSVNRVANSTPRGGRGGDADLDYIPPRGMVEP